jgi:hypothetical protein
MLAALIPLAHAGHLLLAIPFAMPVVLLGGTLGVLVLRDRRAERGR